MSNEAAERLRSDYFPDGHEWLRAHDLLDEALAAERQAGIAEEHERWVSAQRRERILGPEAKR